MAIARGMFLSTTAVAASLIFSCFDADAQIDLSKQGVNFKSKNGSYISDADSLDHMLTVKISNINGGAKNDALIKFYDADSNGLYTLDEAVSLELATYTKNATTMIRGARPDPATISEDFSKNSVTGAENKELDILYDDKTKKSFDKVFQLPGTLAAQLKKLGF